MDEYSNQSSDFLQVMNKCISNFLGSPVLFPSFEEEIIDNLQIKIIKISLYDQIWQYSFILLLLFMALYAIYRFKTSSLIHLVILYFSVDVFIHLVIRFGLDSAFLCGGHWVFLVPILLGWFYKSFALAYHKYINFVLGILLIILFANNFFRLTELYDFAISYYHV